MDMTAVASMVMTIILVALIGGFVLLRPIAKRVGLLLEQKLQDRQSAAAIDEVRQLRERMQLLEEEVRLLNERQRFTDELISRGAHRDQLPRSSATTS